MKIIPLTVLAATLALGFSACGSDKPSPPPPLLIHDTTGAAYLYVCGGNNCAIQATTGTPPFTCSDGSTFSYTWDRFFTIAIFGAASLQRPVACNAGDTCPTAPDGTVYTCIDGLCQQPGSQGDMVYAFDAVNLCQARDPWPPDCGTAFLADPSYSVAANAVLAACPDAQVYFNPQPDASVNAVCPVPAGCLQP